MTIRRISVIPLGRQGHHYRDGETGREYRRIFAGIHWPGINLGTVVVIAEDLYIDVPESQIIDKAGVLTVGATSDDRKLRVLSEYGNRNISGLLARCQALRNITKVERFFGDTTNRIMMRLKRSSEFIFRLTEAPGVDDLRAHETYLSVIREKATTPDEKILNFVKCPELKKELNSLTDVPTADSFRNDFPYTVAFAYALLALEVFTHEEPIYHPEVSYKPLDTGVGM